MQWEKNEMIVSLSLISGGLGTLGALNISNKSYIVGVAMILTSLALFYYAWRLEEAKNGS